jgi:hypothetical protein
LFGLFSDIAGEDLPAISAPQPEVVPTPAHVSTTQEVKA